MLWGLGNWVQGVGAAARLQLSPPQTQRRVWGTQRGAAECIVDLTGRSVLQETTAHIPQVTIQITAP